MPVLWNSPDECIPPKALRSGYTAYPQNITSSMHIPMVGTQNITTMGWTFNKIRVYALFPITFTAVMTFAAIAYALYYAHLSEQEEKRQEVITTVNGTGSVPPLHDGHSGYLVVPRTAIATFDASDPMHLVVAAAARRLVPGSQTGHVTRYWERYEDIVVYFQLDR